ncbi:hypothetical protein [Tomitella biformata]|uniref:hypothetical protein n=1 Tax=Tomitella biformata TaxID=630403 RepID=UPI00046472AC|nr:hypothetical protein [Tomitella biformata]
MRIPVLAKSIVAVSAIALVCGGAVSACGSSTDSTATTTAAAASGTTTSGSAATSGSAETASLPTFTITADQTTPDGKMSYSLSGAEAEAGVVTVELKNADTMMPHQAQLLRLNDGVTSEQFTAAILGPEGIGAVMPLATFAGGPNAVGPGGTSSVIANLEPSSTYMVICQIPGPGGKPHYALGMMGSFTTSTQANSAAMPTSSNTVELSDFRFSEPAAIDWNKPMTVTNDGPEPHELTVLGAAPGKTLDDVKAALASEPAGQPPYVTMGGVAALADGMSQDTTLTLQPGSYLLVCFVVDPATGQPHYMLGMEQEITVS